MSSLRPTINGHLAASKVHPKRTHLLRSTAREWRADLGQLLRRGRSDAVRRNHAHVVDIRRWPYPPDVKSALKSLSFRGPRRIAEKSVEAAYALLLAEKGLSKDAPPNVPPLSAGAALAESANDLRLVRLATLSGVNALATGQEIAFNAKLTVLFGENAAGKTGYVRVLKRVASVRSAQAILGNVHGPVGGKPHATIDYSLSGTPQSHDWNDEAGVPPFTRMSVFDSGAVALHVDDDLTYLFTPGELALFLYVHRAIDAVVTTGLRGYQNQRNHRSPGFAGS